MAETPTQHLTTRRLARMWLVSEATIKRWADAGHLRSSRTLGGHRRFTLKEASRFQKERGLGPAPAPKAARPRRSGARAARRGPWDNAAGFFEAVAGGREESAAAVVLGAFLRGVELSEIFDGTVAPAMRRVGDLWHDGEMTVADEHLATRTAIRAVEALVGAARAAPTGARQAICCAPEDELHEVPLLCLQALLENEGWGVINLGAHTPFFALAEAVEKHRPALVCVSSTTEGALARGAREYGQFREAARACGARVALGGAGFRDPGVRRRFPADLHADSFRDLLELVREG